MTKKIIIIVIAMLLFGGIAIAKGEWSKWWQLDGSLSMIRRIYDHENKLVCWVFDGGGIDCEPSLELNHPLLIP